MPISLDEFSFTFEIPELDDLPAREKKRALEEVGEYLLDSILDYVGSAKSPVKGGKYKAKLSEQYAESQKMGDDTANLDLTGGMLDSLIFQVNPESSSVTLAILDDSQIPKAYNHNVGDTLPARTFLPNDDKDQTFKDEIRRGIDRLIAEYLEDYE